MRCPSCNAELCVGISIIKKRELADVPVEETEAEACGNETEDVKETEACGNERYPPPPGGPCF